MTNPESTAADIAINNQVERGSARTAFIVSPFNQASLSSRKVGRPRSLVQPHPAAFASPRDSCSAPFSRALPSFQPRWITILLSGRSFAVPSSFCT